MEEEAKLTGLIEDHAKANPGDASALVALYCMKVQLPLLKRVVNRLERIEDAIKAPDLLGEGSEDDARGWRQTSLDDMIQETNKKLDKISDDMKKLITPVAEALAKLLTLPGMTEGKDEEDSRH